MLWLVPGHGLEADSSLNCSTACSQIRALIAPNPESESQGWWFGPHISSPLERSISTSRPAHLLAAQPYPGGVSLNWEQTIIEALDPPKLGRWWLTVLGWQLLNDPEGNEFCILSSTTG